MMASIPPPSPYLQWDILRPCLKCCNRFWISELAIFSECVGVIAWIPPAISLLLLILRYGLRPVWNRRPIWLRTFAAEEPSEAGTLSAELPASSTPKAWGISAAVLATNSAVGLVISLLAGLKPTMGPLFLLPLIPHIATLIVLLIDRPRSTPGAVLILQVALLFIQLILFNTIIYITTSKEILVWIVEICISLGSVIFIINMPMRDPLLASDDICSPYQTPTSSLRSPEDNFTLWNWMSVGWMTPIVGTAYLRQLHHEDVWKLPLEFQHNRLHRLFRDVNGSVLSRILKVNAPDLIITTVLGTLESLCSLVPVIFLKQLLTALEGENPNRKVAMVYGVFILMARLISAQSGIFNIWFCRRAYERCRGEMITMIYEKTLMRKAFTFPSDIDENDTEKTKKPKAANSEPASMGKILNLMRNDVYEIAQRFWEFANLFTKPMTFILTIVLIWKILGPAALGGVLLIVTAQVLNAFIIRALVSWERARRAVTDVKLQVTSQFVEAIRHLRWYDWQDKWLGQILASRKKELRYRVIVNLISKVIAATNKLSAYFFPVAAFYAYTIIGKKPLLVDVAFPALTLFAQLNQNLNELPALVTVLLNASVAMGRIESFMAEPNKEQEFGSGAYGESGTHPPEELDLSFKEASFTWPGCPPDRHVLSNITFSAKKGLTAICGKVGGGKTALLHAILGELDEQGGTRKVPNEMVGYCAQTPWLQSMSIRENILFSAGLDEARYRQVLSACCLIPDLAGWKAGDLSLIGENGVGLSGGQKARVALARAVYSKARILLLDDPIAALDHQTAESILRNLFTNTNLMEGRMVFFVTHRMDVLTRYADQVLEISPVGTMTVISKEEIKFHAELLHFAAKDDQRRASVDDGQAGDADDNAEDIVPDKFIEEEHRAHGGVMMSVYWKYVKAGNLWYWLALVVLFTVFRASRLAHYYFIKIWGESYDKEASTAHMYLAASNKPEYYFNPSPSSTFGTSDSEGWPNIRLDLPPPDTNPQPWLFWFFIIALLQFVTFVMSDITIVILIYTAGKHLFEEVMQKVANATFRFYDVTPVGRLMNRLTSDIGTIDGQIVTQIRDVAWYFMFWSTSLFVIATTTPVFLVIALLMTTTFVLIFMRFLPASQSLRRLEMVSLSPLMSNFGTLLEGLTTVRAFRAQPHFEDQIIVTTDAFQQMDHFFWSLQAWLMFRFDILSALSTFILTLSAVFTGLSAGTVGFVLGTAANFVACTHNLCRKYGDLQMQFVSVERVIELMDLEQEPRGDIDPPAAWPGYDDDIIFDNVTVRYAKGLQPSLKNLSFRIPAGSMVAVTGRTGSGKSTLALTLLGTMLPDLDETTGTVGSIRIGNIDVARVDKHALRKRISFVAQDPVLFPGSLRDNLDPIGEYSDEECALVLKRVLGTTEEAEVSISGSATPGASGATSGNLSPTSSSSSTKSSSESDRVGDGNTQPATTNTDSNGGDTTPTTNTNDNRHHSSSQFTLATRIDGGGKNLSQGHRQLIGLGRAVLRRSPVVILDEATASIDKKTAFYIQQVLREELKESTVITIAHRVEAVKDADFEIVLDKGKVVKAQAIIGG